MDLVITLERINTPFSAGCLLHIFLWDCSSFAMYSPFSVPGHVHVQDGQQQGRQVHSPPCQRRLNNYSLLHLPPGSVLPAQPSRAGHHPQPLEYSVCAEHNPASAFWGAEEEREKVEETQHQAGSVPSKRRLLSGGNPADNPTLLHRVMPGGAIKQNSVAPFRQTQSCLPWPYVPSRSSTKAKEPKAVQCQAGMELIKTEVLTL